MNELDHPVWASLTGRHQHLALGTEKVKKYPSSISPFVGIDPSYQDWSTDLRTLLEPSEEVVIMGPASSELNNFDTLFKDVGCQMIYEGSAFEISTDKISRLSEKDELDLYDLTRKVYPGYYRKKSWMLGDFIGINEDDQLVAMLGQRMNAGQYRELSTLCTLPDYQGQGYGTLLLKSLINQILGESKIPFLHVSVQDSREIARYERMGFKKRAEIEVRKIRAKSTLT